MAQSKRGLQALEYAQISGAASEVAPAMPEIGSRAWNQTDVICSRASQAVLLEERRNA